MFHNKHTRVEHDLPVQCLDSMGHGAIRIHEEGRISNPDNVQYLHNYNPSLQCIIFTIFTIP